MRGLRVCAGVGRCDGSAPTDDARLGDAALGSSATRARPPAARPPSCSGPRPRRATTPATLASAVNVFSWSGPRSVTSYSGTPRSALAVSSWRLVFQSRPAPSCGAGLDDRVEQRVHGASGGLDAVRDVDRADQRLEGVGQDRRLVPTAGGLLAPTEPDEDADVDRAGDVGQRAHVHDGGAQLRQLPLGQVGVCAVERVGDDQSEHGVAEELQPLVGRQATVLVRVRAVGERPGRQRRRRSRRHRGGPSDRQAPSSSPATMRSDVQDLALVVRPAGGARDVRQLGLTALRARHEVRLHGLPLGAARPRPGTRHLALGYGHG